MSSPYHDFDTIHVVDGKELVRPARLGPNYTSEEMVTWLRAVHEYNSAVAAAHSKAFDKALREALAAARPRQKRQNRPHALAPLAPRKQSGKAT